MSKLRRSVDAQDWAKGPQDAPLTILEYADFECPFCGRAFHELKRLELTAGDQVRLIFRHFPLTQMHPDAQLAAEAAEAAGGQGRFWEMHDLLFLNQQNLEPPALVGYASELDLDVARFTSDLEEHRYLPRVRRSFMEGVRSGVNGTPTFFVNGERWDRPYTAEAFLAELRGGADSMSEPAP
jgi:protein-disulfide isomerase